MIIFGMEARTSLGSESAITGKQGDVFGFGMLVLEAVVGKKEVGLDRRHGRDDGSVGFCISTHERGEKGIFGLLG
jgi:hypothetical protein